MGKDNPSYARAGMRNRSVAASPTDVKIHTNCFPLLHDHEKMDDGSVECMDA